LSEERQAESKRGSQKGKQMNEKFYALLADRRAPRETGKMSHADLYCWEVAKRAYVHGIEREASVQRSLVAWGMLDPNLQDLWFWVSKAVMAGLDDLQ
jgi:hypothetical protein